MPPAWTTVTLSGTVYDTNGSPAVGVMEFEPDQRVVDPAAFFVLPPIAIRVRLDAAGFFSVVLPATDNAGWTPAGWKWKITERVEGNPVRTISVLLPSTTPTVEYTDLI